MTIEIIWDEFDPEWDSPNRIANCSNVEDSWHKATDPYGVVPVGWVCKRNTYKVICFSDLRTDESSNGLMVCIKYKNCTGRYSTTREYRHVLEDYENETQSMDEN